MEAVGNVRTGEAQAFGDTFFATAVNPETESMFNVDWKEGSNAVLGSLGEDGAFVDENYADDHDLRVGSPIDLTFANGETKQFVDRGRLRPSGRRLAVRQRHDLAGDLGRVQPSSRATSTRSCAPRAARPTRTSPRSSRR